jgi:hypothetical protein
MTRKVHVESVSSYIYEAREMPLWGACPAIHTCYWKYLYRGHLKLHMRDTKKPSIAYSFIYPNEALEKLL